MVAETEYEPINLPVNAQLSDLRCAGENVPVHC